VQTRMRDGGALLLDPTLPASVLCNLELRDRLELDAPAYTYAQALACTHYFRIVTACFILRRVHLVALA
jgi:hypothetical protein